MTKLKPSLRNSTKPGLLLSTLCISFFILGCTSSTTPTYLKENIDEAIQDVSKKEYGIDVKARVAGETLWVYLPLENLLVKADKPQKYREKFVIEENNSAFGPETLKVEYLIRTAPEREMLEEYQYNKDALEKSNKVWKVMLRVLLSMERIKRGEPEFLCLVTADTKNGLEIYDTAYTLDLKKFIYEFISRGEYQHRLIQESRVDPAIIGDKEGRHLDYRNTTLKEFAAKQIMHRIKLKFQKPEVNEKADVEKEILKIVAITVKTYGVKDFSHAELFNMLTKNKVILSRAAVWAKPTE